MTHRLAIVIPVYNEENAIVPNMETLLHVLAEDDIEARIILVDDGSTDLSWLSVKAVADAHPNVQGLRLSRNFGKEAAICAGLENADAELYLVMDSDLQHPPRYIREMLRLMEETGADIVEGVKRSRGREGVKSKILAKAFYRVMKAASGLDLDNSSDFKLMRRPVVDALRALGESSVFFRGITSWVGFARAEMPFAVDPREHGASRFSTMRLMKLALNSILSYTSKPLYITVLFGAAFFVGALILGVQTLVNFFTGNTISGFTTVILLLLITGSLILLCLGIIGIYVSRIYNEVKRRPRYILSDKTRTAGESS